MRKKSVVGLTDGLNDHIRAHVTTFCHEDFSKIVTCALNVERVKKEEREKG